MQSKIVTYVGLAIGTLGAALAFLGGHNVGGPVLVGVGLLLSGVGRSLLGAAVLCLLLSASGCKGGVSPNVVQAGVTSVETSICILNVSSKDVAAGKSAGDTVADCIQQCGTDAATIARVLDAHHAAEMREAETR
jgi:hypothetical protein